MDFILFSPFKSQVLSYNSVQLFQIVGIFLQFGPIHIFQIVGIFLQFGPIHMKKFTLFKSYNLPKIWFNHSNFLAHIFKIVDIFLQFGSLHIFQSVGIFLQFSSIHIFQIFLQFGPIHIINSLFSNRIIFLQFGLIIAIFLHTSVKL